MINFKNSANPLIDAIEIVYKAAGNSEFKEENFEKVKGEIEVVREFFKLDEQPAIALSVLLGLYFDGEDLIMKELLGYLKLKLSSYLHIQELLKPFLQAEWIKPNNSSRQNQLSNFTLNQKFIQCVLTGNWKHMERKPCQNSFDLLNEFGKTLKERRSQDISYNKLIEKAEKLLVENDKTPISVFIKDQGLDELNKMMYLSICYNHATGDENFSVESLLNDLKPSMEDQFKVRQEFKTKKAPLLKMEIVEECLGFELRMSDNEYRLSEKGIKAFMPDYTSPKTKTKSTFLELVEPSSISQKELFYNEKEGDSIRRLTEILKQDKYLELTTRLSQKGKKPSITTILYGAPGTGKTETALQLAKMSGRTVLMADVSSLRSKWVGETERFTKKLFLDYEKFRKEKELCPILLFNEADSFLSKRRPITDKVDQMENTMQNIILQELEKFEGIFIATTNLETNLDEAYDRRITFKIRYSAPSQDARLSIWKQKLPETDIETLKLVNQRFELTGGQIDNICKKIEVDTLLMGEEIVNHNYLLTLAEEEISLRNNLNKKQIGFSFN